MKNLCVFIGSSKELIKERNYISYLTVALEKHFASRDLRVTLSKWEYVDPSLTHVPTENRYLQEMLKSDLALIIYWRILGKWTKLEYDTALNALEDESCLLNKVFVLYKENFSGDEEPSQELQEWKNSHQDENSGVFTNLAVLGVQFLHQLDAFQHTGEPLLRIENGSVKCDDFTVAGVEECPAELIAEIARPCLPVLPLPDVPETAQAEKTITAFLAADEELHEIRDILADMSLELNKKWQEQNVRFKLFFYKPEMKEMLFEQSDLALIIYRSKTGVFGREAVLEAYEKFDGRCYVFFQDIAEIPTQEFLDFKESFSEKLGQFTCSFREPDTIRYKFALHIAPSFLSYDSGSGKVMLDKYPVAQMNKVTMLTNHAEFQRLQQEASELSREFKEKQDEYEKHPENKSLFSELYHLQKKCDKNEQDRRKLENDIFQLSQNIASLKDELQKSKIIQLESLLDAGKIEELTRCLADNMKHLSQAVVSYGENKKALRAQGVREIRTYTEMEMIRINAYLIPGLSSYKQNAETVLSLFADLCKVLEQDEDFLEILAEIKVKCIGFCAKYSAVSAEFAARKKMLLPSVFSDYEKLLSQAQKEENEEKIIKFSLALADLHHTNATFLYSRHQRPGAVKEINKAVQILRQIVSDHPGVAEDQLAETILTSADIYFKRSQTEKRSISLKEIGQFKASPAVCKEVIKNLKEALALCSAYNSSVTAEIHEFLGTVFTANNEYENGENEWLQALAIRKAEYTESLEKEKDKRQKFIFSGMTYTSKLQSLARANGDLANFYLTFNEVEKAAPYWEEACRQLGAVLAARPTEYEIVAYLYLRRSQVLRFTGFAGGTVEESGVKDLLHWSEAMYEELVKVDSERYLPHLYTVKQELAGIYLKMFCKDRDSLSRAYACNYSFELFQINKKMKSEHFAECTVGERIWGMILWTVSAFFRKRAKEYEREWQADKCLYRAEFYSQFLKEHAKALMWNAEAEKIIAVLCKEDTDIFYQSFYASILKQKYLIYRDMEKVEKASETLEKLVDLYRSLSERNQNYKISLAIALEEYGLCACGEVMNIMGTFFYMSEAGRPYFLEALEIYQELSDERTAIVKSYMDDLDDSLAEKKLYMAAMTW